VFNATWNAAKAIVSAGVAAILFLLVALPQRALGALTSLIGVVRSVFTSAAGAARSGASSVVTGAISVLLNLPGRIRSALSTVRSAVTGAFAGAAGWLVSAGRNIIAGVRNGIVSAIGGAVAAARNAAKRIVDGFKSALSIGSPSKVMETEVGRWIPAGVADGIRKNMKPIKTQIDAVVGPDLLGDLPKFLGPRPRGGDGSALGGLHVTIQAGAIVIQGQGREAGREAAEAILERLGAATLAR
jgi:hypothetical protein